MDILSNVTFSNTPTPKFVATQIRRSLESLVKSLVISRNTIYNQFWSNPIQIAQELGTSLRSTFEHDEALVIFITQRAIAAGIPIPPLPGKPTNYNVTFNPDGSGVITLN